MPRRRPDCVQVDRGMTNVLKRRTGQWRSARDLAELAVGIDRDRSAHRFEEGEVAGRVRVPGRGREVEPVPVGDPADGLCLVRAVTGLQRDAGEDAVDDLARGADRRRRTRGRRRRTGRSRAGSPRRCTSAHRQPGDARAARAARRRAAAAGRSPSPHRGSPGGWQRAGPSTASSRRPTLAASRRRRGAGTGAATGSPGRDRASSAGRAAGTCSRARAGSAG